MHKTTEPVSTSTQSAYPRLERFFDMVDEILATDPEYSNE